MNCISWSWQRQKRFNAALSVETRRYERARRHQRGDAELSGRRADEAVVRPGCLMHDHRRRFDWLRGQMRLCCQVNRLGHCIISPRLRRLARRPFRRPMMYRGIDRRMFVCVTAPEFDCNAVNFLLSLHHQRMRCTALKIHRYLRAYAYNA